jgi:hypothetical protein
MEIEVAGRRVEGDSTGRQGLEIYHEGLHKFLMAAKCLILIQKMHRNNENPYSELCQIL